ncbi:unnamed protein product [Ilex paraguariensis]|uniref:Clp R domain-containing protein n=1 Tax=Ilex paraguariensis TaxID=185542 RepID=A0ABC8UHT5_9AQUA
MRAGDWTAQQTLTSEAATIVKQALALARRRGHAQVTPLHVATTMLSASTGLLRTACLQSHSHPLQCKALELCFNVALNRLPASSSNPILGPHSQHPSISNALVAAFKRAQAHQRRGSIENQQQPLLAVKIELEQLIISILDDPSVSRVMREAGFSSTQVKTNVEQAVSLELCSQTPPPSNKSKENNLLVLSPSPSMGQIGAKVSKPKSSDQVSNEDVMSVIGNLMNRRRKSFVIVGECLDIIEGVVGVVMDRIEKRDVSDPFMEVKFTSLPLLSLNHLSREDVDQKLGELRCLVNSCVDKGVVLYLGDIKWVIDYRANCGRQERSCYCPVEHMIMELGRMVCGLGENGRFRLMGIATFQTYMRCRTSHYSLEAVWGDLHPVTISADSLGLSLIPDSDTQSEPRSKKKGNGPSWLLFEGDHQEKQLDCCADCSSKFDSEARSLYTTSSLPSWLQDDIRRPTTTSNSNQYGESITELCKKWNSICSSVHKQSISSDITLNVSSISPSSSTSCFSYDPQYTNLDQTQQAWPMSQPKQSWSDHQFWPMSHPKNALSSKPNSMPNSASSSEIMGTEYVQKFKEFNAENLNTLCNALEEKVPWQKYIIPEIVGTILQCRSGMLRRKEKLQCNETKEETWLLFQGVDTQAKERISRELAKVVFGSHSNFVSIALSSFSSTRADSTEDFRKRSRNEQSCTYVERFAEAVSSNPHRIFFVEDVEQADYWSQMGLKRAIERGRITNSNGEEVCLSDAIVILSCESFSSRSRACSPPVKQKSDRSEEDKGKGLEETSPCVSLDLNISFEDDSAEHESIDDIGLLDSVDRCIMFKVQEL